MHCNRIWPRPLTELEGKQARPASGKLLMAHTFTQIMTSGRRREGTEGALYETSNEMFDVTRARIEGTGLCTGA